MNTDSACVTSILRTYYTWKVVKGSDVSYNIIVMGLWTLAEIATGIIVSCLPVLPRFFRHAGPKVLQAFSVPTKSSSSSGCASTRVGAGPWWMSPTSPPFEARHLTIESKNLNDLRIHNTHVHGDSTELEGYNAMTSKASAIHELRPGPNESNRDVESGGYGFPVL